MVPVFQCCKDKEIFGILGISAVIFFSVCYFLSQILGFADCWGASDAAIA